MAKKEDLIETDYQRNSTALLKECYKLFMNIEDDGWIIRGSSGETIRQLQKQIRSWILTGVPHKETQSTQIACLNNCGLFIVDQWKDSCIQFGECPICKRQYQIIWKQNEVMAEVIDMEELRNP